MMFKFIKQGNFLGTKCDFYIDEEENIYMSRTQIGYALEYTNASKAIENIHSRHKERLDKFSIKIKGAQIEGGSKHIDKKSYMYLYKERGIYAICGYSKQPIAERFNDWVYDVIISIRKNGYYIATEKDNKWLSVRRENKEVRRSFTDEIQEFVYYATKQGSKKPEMYYIHFTKLVNEKLGIPKDIKRENLNQEQLMDITALERVMSMKLPKLINKEMNYKNIYQEIKKLIALI